MFLLQILFYAVYKVHSLSLSNIGDNSMVNRSRLALVGGFLALTLLTGTTALAQGGGGGGGGRGGGGRFGGGMMMGRGGGGLQLLTMKEVQTELKMTQDQIDKATAKQQEMMQQMRDARQNGGTPPDPAEMQKTQEKAVADILNADQLKRFKQLQLQREGVQAFNRKEVAEALKLTDDQKTKIKDIQKKEADDRTAAMQGVDFRNMTPEDRQKLMDKNMEMQKASNDQILAVLTDDQKKTWKDMQGEPFKFPAAGPRRGGGGG